MTPDHTWEDEMPWTHEALARTLHELEQSQEKLDVSSIFLPMLSQAEIERAREILKAADAPDDTEFMRGAYQALEWVLGSNRWSQFRIWLVQISTERSNLERQVEP